VPRYPTPSTVASPTVGALRPATPSARPVVAPIAAPAPISSPVGKTTLLQVVLLDGYGDPMSKVAYVLQIEDQTYAGTTDGDGFLREWIPEDATGGTLTAPGIDVAFRLTTLAPADDIRGMQQRLNNLGYVASPAADGVTTEQTVLALKQFQYAEGLDVTGKLDPATKARLETVYGG
jgi:Putative peptidoglycan binding domain